MQYPSWGCYFGGNYQHFLHHFQLVFTTLSTLCRYFYTQVQQFQKVKIALFFFIISLGFHVSIVLAHFSLSLLPSTPIPLCPISTLDKSNLYRLSITRVISCIWTQIKCSVFLLKMTGSPNGQVFPNYQPQILSPLHPSASSGILNVHILSLTSDWVSTNFCLLFPA